MIIKEDSYTEEFIQLRMRFKNCFRKYPDVLNQLLSDMGTFQKIEADPGQVALRNYGVHLLELIGAYDEEGIENTLQGYINLPAIVNKSIGDNDDG